MFNFVAYEYNDILSYQKRNKKNLFRNENKKPAKREVCVQNQKQIISLENTKERVREDKQRERERVTKKEWAKINKCIVQKSIIKREFVVEQKYSLCLMCVRERELIKILPNKLFIKCTVICKFIYKINKNNNNI